ncbi:MAG: LPS-assembly protein LptD [Desulfobacteraceae bacterium]|nr:LPS-assembly protein LptD [Desulfobacteraceae bacterium]
MNASTTISACKINRFGRGGHRCAVVGLQTVWFRLMLAVTWMILGFTFHHANADVVNQKLLEENKNPWHITADRFDHDENKSEYIAQGAVIIKKNTISLTADYVRFNHLEMKAFARGNIFMTDGGDVLTGDRLDLDLNTETGVLHGGTVFIKESHFYIRGNRIEKTGKQTYSAQKASITTCDGDKPDWKITARHLKITVEGYGRASNSAFWVADMPILYVPWMIFPVKTKRQSGLLAPAYGYSSRNGNEATQPLYWAINDHSDATFYYQFVENRGHRFGSEFRYTLSDRTLGTLMVDGLEDRKVDDGLDNNSSKWGFDDTGTTDFRRPNEDRYWFRMKHDQRLPFGFTGSLDLDVVSDQDYLNEFKNGYMGTDASNDFFLEHFGRELEPTDDRVRKSSAAVRNTWGRYTLNAGAFWNDDVVKRRQADVDPTLQRLPHITFDGSRQPLMSMPLDYTLASEYTRFFRRDGIGTGGQNITDAHRLDVHPRVYLPLAYRNYFNFEPSLGVRETLWQISHFENREYDADTEFHRDLYDIKLDLTSKFYKVYAGAVQHADRVKHELQPQLVYDYIPEEDQDHYPLLEKRVDRIGRKSVLTYALTQTLTSRTLTPQGDTGQPVETDPVYNRFLRLKLAQSYDFNEAATSDDDPRPFSAVSGEVDIKPKKYINIDTDAAWNVYDSELETYNTGLILWDGHGNQISAEYRYKRDDPVDTTDGLESIGVNGRIKMSDALFAFGGVERNLRDDTTIQTHYGFSFSKGCWSVETRYTHEDDDTRYTVLFNLLGLGKIGN